jgi:GNAT superfamily N-acetyltransferase
MVDHDRVTSVAIRSITADEAFPLRREHLRPALPVAASRYSGDDDPAALHCGALTSGQLVGVVSFLPRNEQGEASTQVYELQGLVTLPSVRNRGIGAQLVEVGIALLAGRAARIWCDGRTPAMSFYQRLGFSAVGKEFVTPATGPHYRFVRDLSSG